MGNIQKQTSNNTQKVRRSNFITRQNKKDRKKFNTTVKLVVLGTGESGKSTLLKQLTLLYRKQSPEKAQISTFKRLEVLHVIRCFIVSNLVELHRVAPRFHPAESELIQENRDILIKLESFEVKEILENRMMLRLMYKLWDDTGIKKTWEKYRHLIQVQDSLPHFMNRFWEIFDAKNDYQVTEDDFLRVRRKSTGIIETSFTFADVTYNIVDVGGQRNERNKWIHAFSDVNAAIWVTAINEYNQLLFEDNKLNRLKDSIDEFSKTISNPKLNYKGFDYIIFLNKTDLYRQKLLKHKISDSFPEFSGPEAQEEMSIIDEDFEKCFSAGIEFFTELLMESAGEQKDRISSVHTTCAMDQHNVHVIFSKVAQELVEDSQDMLTAVSRSKHKKNYKKTFTKV